MHEHDHRRVGLARRVFLDEHQIVVRLSATARRAKSANALGCVRCAVWPASSITTRSAEKSSASRVVDSTCQGVVSVLRPMRHGTVTSPNENDGSLTSVSSCASNSWSRARSSLRRPGSILQAGAEMMLHVDGLFGDRLGVRPPVGPRDGRFEDRQRGDEVGPEAGGEETDRTAVAVGDDRGAPLPHRDDDVVRVFVEGLRRRCVAGPSPAPPVVGDHRELGHQLVQHAGEARTRIEHPVHEHDHRRVGVGGRVLDDLQRLISHGRGSLG